LGARLDQMVKIKYSNQTWDEKENRQVDDLSINSRLSGPENRRLGREPSNKFKVPSLR
jgi:hypothetical protein